MLRRDSWKKIAEIMAAAGISLLWVCFVYHKCGIYFETNDDRILTEIMSGAFSASWEGHVVHVNYLLAKPLAILYGLIPEVAWYGLFLISAHVLVYSVVLYQFMQRARGWPGKVTVTITLSAVLSCALQLLAMIQFTSTAALLAIGGYVCLLLEKEGKRRYLLFFVFELMGFLLRQDAMMMIQIMGIGAWCGLLMGNRELEWRDKLKRAGITACVLMAVIGLGIAVNKVAYHSSEWKEYLAFNDARAGMFDYYGTPEYDGCIDILDKYDVTKAEYEAYRQYTILDYDVSTKCAQELAERAEQICTPQRDWLQIFRQIMYMRFGEVLYGINIVSMLVIVLMLLWIFIQRSYYLLWPLFGIGIGEFCVWFYLMWKGRTPNRVIFPIFVCDILILISLLIRDCCAKRDTGEEGRKESLGRRILSKGRSAGIVLIAGLWLLIGIQGCSVGRKQYQYVTAQNQSQAILMQSMYEIGDYCRAHPGNRYLVGAASFGSFKGAALDAGISRKRNYALTGTWYSNSPASRQYLSQYFGTERDGIYLIVYENLPADGAALAYLEEKTESAPVKVDSFGLSSGAVCEVYYFEE